MKTDIEPNHLVICLNLIEEKLNRGPSTEWTGYDFEQLSICIQEETGTLLSVTTLKRIWGKIKYNSLPTTNTLNTLAQFAGYTDWNSFKRQTDKKSIVSMKPSSSSNDAVKNHFPKKLKYAFGILLVILTLSSLIFFSIKKDHANIDEKAFQFSSSKILSQGIPNSVIFNYNAQNAKTDEVYIAQSWDTTRKTKVPKDQNLFSSIYYEPGFFKAQLIVGSTTVKEHDLMITTNGWTAMAILDQHTTPYYFKQDEILNENQVKVDEKLLTNYNINLQPNLPNISLFNVQEQNTIKANAFTFETSIKSDYTKGNAICQRSEIIILMKDDIISIPLASKGCVGDLSLYALGTTKDSKHADLSKFGCDLSQWVHVRLHSKGDQIEIYINDSLASSLKTLNTNTDIIGLRFNFQGTGAIRDTKLYNNTDKFIL